MNWSLVVCVLCIILPLNVCGQKIDNLVVTAKGKTWLFLEWTVAEKPVYMYKLEYNEVNNSTTEVVRPSPDQSNYRLTGLKPGTEYQVQLTAYSLMSQGGSQSITGKTCGGPSNSITNITATQITHESLSIEWSGPANDYSAKLWTPNGMEWTAVVPSSNMHTFGQLQHTKPYYVLVNGQNSAEGCSIDAAMAGLFYVHAKSRVPAVSSLSAEALGPDSVLVQWKGLDLATAPFVYGFNYEIKKKSGGFSKLGSLPANAMSLTIGGLDAVTEYEVIITTVGIYSRHSSMSSVKTSPGRPSAPQDLTTSVTGTTLTAEWKAPVSVPGKLSKYRVALYKNGNIQDLKEIEGTKATFADVDETMYYTVKVAAFVESVNGLGGGYGPEVSSGLVIEQKPAPRPPGVPTLNTLEPAGSTAVKATWTEVSQAYGYLFTFASSNKPPLVFVVSSSLTYAVFKGLEPRTEYTVTVQAMSLDDMGEKAQSRVVTTLDEPPMTGSKIRVKKSSENEEKAKSLLSFKEPEVVEGNLKKRTKLGRREASVSTQPQHTAYGAKVLKLPLADQDICSFPNANCTKNASTTSNQKKLAKAIPKLEDSSGGGRGSRTIVAVAACVVAVVVLVGLTTLAVMRRTPRPRSHAAEALPV